MRYEIFSFYRLSLFQNRYSKYFLIPFFLLISLFFRSFSIFIPSLGINIGLQSLPIIIFGSYYGVGLGFIYGIISDLLGYVTFNQNLPFFGMYSFQSGIIGFLSGLIPFLFSNRSIRKVSIFRTILLLTGILLVSFLFFSKDIGIVLLGIFSLFCLSVIKKVCDKRENTSFFFYYSLALVLLLALIPSFIGGTYSTLEYSKYFLNSGYYGGNFYTFLSARVFKELVKAPMLISFLVGIFSVHSPLKRFDS